MDETHNEPSPEAVQAEADKLKAIYQDRKREAQAIGQKLNQDTVAERCGWAGQSAVSQYMTGRMPLNLEALLKLSKALRFMPSEVSPRLAKEIPTIYLAGSDPGDSKHHIRESDATPMAGTRARLPVIGQASAGHLEEIIERQEIEEWVSAPGPTGPKAFALRIEGISMEPRFLDGEKVIIDPDLDWCLGDYVFARRVSDNTGTFKQIRREGDDLYLCAVNEHFSPRYTRIDHDWVVVGKARWKLTDL
ncbi:XRE family transcriptional regulator [Halomonas sp. EGI 63088]|uniref:XRE family transcriptional regulator n=1 Tax=Halomonas flagellata TaxID=2920385 RepID=A0ABS9RU72_9GAMM|nr:XRE family transcriptional regulator [Halomonas flagellata]MCH4563370.1 XRE family transcriptional regulator [Halomonas flagellata]